MHYGLQLKELTTATKESDKLAEEVNSQAVKVKWAQNKLKTELEAHKVCNTQKCMLSFSSIKTSGNLES